MKTKQQIANEIKLKVSAFFEQSFSDEHGYVSEKIKRIQNLSEDDVWVAFQMCHPTVRAIMFPRMSKDAQQYLKDNQVI